MFRRILSATTTWLLLAAGSWAGVTDINGVFQRPTPLHDTAVANPPVITNNFSTSYTISQDGIEGYDDIQFWSKTYLFFFSEDGGTTARPFLENEAFDISFDLTIRSPLSTPRKAAGFGLEIIGLPGFGSLRPQYVVRTNFDTPRPTGTDPGFGTGTPGNSLISGTPFPFQPSFDGAVGYSVNGTVNLRMIYTPPERDNMGNLVTVGLMEFLADDLNDGMPAFTTGPQNMNSEVGGIPDGMNIGFRVQTWAGSSTAGDSYATTFANFKFSDPSNPGVPGDYNGNGVVDAADYTVWRNLLGQAGPLLNEVETPNMVTTEDYTYWRSRFGATSGSGSGVRAAVVPEPSSCVLAFASAVGALLGFCRENRKLRERDS